MARKPKVQARVPQDTYENLQRYCDDNDVSEADAVRRAIENEYGEIEVLPDGGRIHRSTHPWIDPLVTFGYRTASASLWILILSAFALAVPGGAIEWYGADLSGETAALFLSLFTIGFYGSVFMLTSSMLAMLILEYLMHPSEAPIRRYFYTDKPDADTGRVVP